jgi:quercetin dioxygenase-like cupin family protein
MNTTITTATPYVSVESEALWYGDSLLEYFVSSEASAGAISVFRATMPEGFGPPRHVHAHEDESFLVLEGEVAFEIDGERVVAGSGASVFAPRNVPHAFRVVSERAVVLGIITPGAFEEMFRTVGVPADSRTLPAPGSVALDIPTLMGVMTRLGVQPLGPPMDA